MLTNENKAVLYNCILKQFPDPGLYKVSRISEWLHTNDNPVEKFGYSDFRGFAEDFPEMFSFQSDNNDDFIETLRWAAGERHKAPDNPESAHPADSFFGTNNIILNDDIIEMTQGSLYALTKTLENGCNVTMMRQEIYNSFNEAKQNGKLTFSGEEYTFPIGACLDGYLVNGVITKNTGAHGKSLYFSFRKTGNVREQPHEERAPQRTAANVPDAEKKRIYTLLTDNFECDTPIHMASISKCLVKSGIDRNKYGCYKMKELLAALDYLTLKDEIFNGVQQTLVTIKRVSGMAISEEKPAVRRENTAAVPSGELTDFCGLPVKPMGILEEYLGSMGIAADYNSISRDLCRDFNIARSEGSVRVVDTKMVFPSGYKKTDGSRVEITLKPNTYGGKAWFLYYVDTVVRDKTSAISPGKQLENFAFLGNWSTFLSELAAKAVAEDWDFRNSSVRSCHILMQYIKYTFSRLVRENKVCISGDRRFAAFNTGLADNHYEDIYVCFIPNDPNLETEWRFAGFCTAANGGLGKQLVDCFNPLPEPPLYFTRKEDLIYNSANQLHTDFGHIIIDNIKRLPIQFLHDQFFDNEEARDITDRIRASRDRLPRAELYDRLKRIICDNDRLFNRIQTRLKAAIELAQKRVRWNYKTAIPCYFPKRDSMSIMLPLALVDDVTPDVALVVELTKSGSYQGQTILTLPQAYIDARLISRLADDWLVPSKIFGDEILPGDELTDAE